MLLLTASDLASITSPIHNCELFLLCLRLFIFPGVISPLISISILDTYSPGEFFFQCPIFLPFHAVHVVLKACILKWFAILFSRGPNFVRNLHQNLFLWVALHDVAHSFIELENALFILYGHKGFPESSTG